MIKNRIRIGDTFLDTNRMNWRVTSVNRGLPDPTILVENDGGRVMRIWESAMKAYDSGWTRRYRRLSLACADDTHLFAYLNWGEWRSHALVPGSAGGVDRARHVSFDAAVRTIRERADRHGGVVWESEGPK